MKYFEVGGQEVVTSVLAESFTKQGHNIVIVSFNPPARLMKERLPEDIPFTFLMVFIILEKYKNDTEYIRKASNKSCY